MPQLLSANPNKDASLCMAVLKTWTWRQLVCSPTGRVAPCLPWLLPDQMSILRVAPHGDHMHMAAGLGMLGSLTCVRLLSTVSKTGAIMEKSVPGELSSWLDLRGLACNQRARHAEGWLKEGFVHQSRPLWTP